jgi:hypothetical protein
MHMLVRSAPLVWRLKIVMTTATWIRGCWIDNGIAVVDLRVVFIESMMRQQAGCFLLPRWQKDCLSGS